jgi:LAGLIDADG DNA endonuclease family
MVTSILLARKLGDKYSVDYKKNQHLSSFQFEALIGLMLGDVFAERNKPTHNTRLNFEQSQSEHESYLLFLYSIFKNLVGTAPKSPKRKPHSITGKTYSSPPLRARGCLAFKTLAFPFLNIFHELFYGTGVKSIPQNISDYFTAISFAF